MSGLVRAHFKLLQRERTPLSRLENGATIFLAWWLVPVTVLVFWLRYLPRHEWIGTGLHVALLVFSVGSAILLHRHAEATLRRNVTAFRWRKPWRDRRTRQAAVALGLGVVFALVSLGAIEGEGRRGVGANPVILKGIATWVPYAFERMGYRTYANLQEADLSTKPATWTGLAERPPEELDKSLVEKAKAELGQVKGARLERTDLRHALAPGAFLAKADLGRANLQGAVLLSANLQKANLIGANLQDANLFFANLREAKLFLANLQGVDLRGANLQGANLFLANLQGVGLQEANLQGAELQGARLSSADLTKVKGLTREQLDGACGDDETTLPDYLADYQMKPCPELEQSPSN